MTVSVGATNYVTMSKSVTLTSSQTLDFQLERATAQLTE